jgi:hypothetical protein
VGETCSTNRIGGGNERKILVGECERKPGHFLRYNCANKNISEGESSCNDVDSFVTTGVA